MARFIFKFSLFFVVALGLSGCGDTATVKYKTTIRMKVGGEIISGSSIRETTYTDQPNSLSGFRFGVSDKGEGIIVDRGVGKSGIFALLNGDTGSKEYPWIVLNCFGIKLGDYKTYIEELKSIAVGQTCQFNDHIHERRKLMPLIVSFSNESNSKTIVKYGTKEFNRAVGAKASFIEFILERVDDSTPLTKAMDARLPWLVRTKGSTSAVLHPLPNGPISKNYKITLANRVTRYYFKD